MNDQLNFIDSLFPKKNPPLSTKIICEEDTNDSYFFLHAEYGSITLVLLSSRSDTYKKDIRYTKRKLEKIAKKLNEGTASITEIRAELRELYENIDDVFDFNRGTLVAKGWE